MLGGGLFGRYFLDTGIQALPEWSTVADAAGSAFRSDAGAVYADLPTEGARSEAEAEQLLIFPLLKLIGWHLLSQQKTGKRREAILDALVFGTVGLQAKALADLVNQAIGLTSSQEALMWRTAPPRTPTSAPSALGEGAVPAREDKS